MMVVAEDQDETPPPDILKGDQLTTEQLDQLQVVLDLAKDTFSDEPGYGTPFWTKMLSFHRSDITLPQ